MFVYGRGNLSLSRGMLGDGAEGTRMSGNAVPCGGTGTIRLKGGDGVAGSVTEGTKSWRFIEFGYNFLPNSPV